MTAMLIKYRGVVIAFVVVAAVAAIAALWLGAWPDRASHILTPVRYQLSWVHNGAFAGYYAADQRGYYAKEGLAVRFIKGGPRLDPVASVLEGRAGLFVGERSAVSLRPITVQLNWVHGADFAAVS